MGQHLFCKELCKVKILSNGTILSGLLTGNLLTENIDKPKVDQKELIIEGLARELNLISQNETHFDNCSKKIQTMYREKAKWIIEYLNKI